MNEVTEQIIFASCERKQISFRTRCPAHTALVISLALMATASCGHKNRSIARVPPAPTPASPNGSRSPQRNNTNQQSLPVGYTEEGTASWYGIPYHGRHAADGEIYDMETLVAAHKLMPFNTWLHVTNLSNGKTVNVRIIDRGPFVEGRIIDLSKAAARQIDLIGPGIGPVRLEVIAAPRDIPANDFYTVQVGSFTVFANAEQMRAQYALHYPVVQISARSGPVPQFRVLVGKFPTIESARELANVLSGENPNIFIVRLDETPVAPATTLPTAQGQMPPSQTPAASPLN
jgi:rare lipoprotein A